MSLDRIAIVLVGTTHPGNIGATARAMGNMGLSDLRLVSPRSFPDDEATARAKRAVAAAVYRAAYHEPLEVKEVPVQPAALVVGGGIAGIEAALRIADAGKKVYLVEREPSIGGYMAQLHKTFPTLDCAA